MEILCAGCGKTALARAEPIYDGFRKIGEAYICTACGRRYASEAETPFVGAARKPRVFTEKDKPVIPNIFSDDERERCCTWCAHFVVNPFSQRCGLTNKFTDATNLCAGFEKKAAEPRKKDGGEKPGQP